MPDSMDWVKANVRTCDECGRETDAGEWPDWSNGVCEICDPELLDNYYPCWGCDNFFHEDLLTKFENPNPGEPDSYLCPVCADK